jgi:hypothetical protein
LSGVANLMSASDCGAEAAHAGHCRKLELGAPSPGLYSALPDFTRTGADPNQLTRCEPSASLCLRSSWDVRTAWACPAMLTTRCMT